VIAVRVSCMHVCVSKLTVTIILLSISVKMLFYICPSIFNFMPNTHNYHRSHRLLLVAVVVAHPPPYSLDVVDSVVSMTQEYSTIVIAIGHPH